MLLARDDEGRNVFYVAAELGKQKIWGNYGIGYQETKDRGDK